MGLESVTYVNDLVTTNPAISDDVAQGDDHLRAIKTALKNTFPNADKAFYLPDFSSKTADFTIVSTDIQKTFIVDTTSGEVAATLPTLASGDDGWTCHFMKSNTGTNALFIVPASGTVQSGECASLAKARRCIPGHRSTAIWTGGAWYITRVPGVPVGSCISFDGATLPVGYEWPNGQTLSSASTKYPEFYVVNGSSGVTVDRRGRVDAAKDDMGGSSANRLTNQTGGLNGDTLGGTGGSEVHTITLPQSASHSHSATTGYNDQSLDHDHTLPGPAANSNNSSIGGGSGIIRGESSRTSDGATYYANGIGGSYGHHTHSVSTNAVGDGLPHNNVQPTIISNKILVVE